MSDADYFQKQRDEINRKEFEYNRALIAELVEMCEFFWLSGSDVISRIVIDDLRDDAKEAIKRCAKLRSESRNKLDEIKHRDKEKYGHTRVQQMFHSQDLIDKYGDESKAVDKRKRIVFSFDESSYEPLDKMIEQGRYPSSYSNNPDDYDEIPVTNPETNETRIVVIPKR